MYLSNLNIPDNGNKVMIPANMRACRTSDGIGCRDPFILLYDKHYYLYRTRNGKIECLIGEDLEHWSEPVVVYDPPGDFHGIKDLFWAPECHHYKGMFYIFTSVYSKTYNHRVISVYRADNPLGPFEDIAGGCVSPKDWDAIDGTLYIDEEKQPWMVFVHEWTSCPDKIGGMVAAKLSEDFTHFISEPMELFRANDPLWTDNAITDGPYMYKTDGHLYMIWSNFTPNNGYAVALAESENGRLDGKWLHRAEPIFQKGRLPHYLTDGGHGSLFLDKMGQLRVVLHGPNVPPKGEYEHVQIYRVVLEKEEWFFLP